MKSSETRGNGLQMQRVIIPIQAASQLSAKQTESVIKFSLVNLQVYK